MGLKFCLVMAGRSLFTSRQPLETSRRFPQVPDVLIGAALYDEKVSQFAGFQGAGLRQHAA